MNSIRPRLDMKSALEHYSTQRNSLKMSTGSGDLDSLIDRIQEGLFYLFYGDSIPLDAISHRLLVNCVLSIKEHGFESMVLKMVLNPEKIANVSKASGIDPKIVSKNLFIQTAYNSQHQVQIANEVAELLENNRDIKLVVVNNLTKFFRDSSGHRRPEIANAIKEVRSTISRASSKNKVSTVVTGDSYIGSKGIIPRPIGGTYLKHLANVIVYVTDISNSAFSSRFKATVVKHQYVKTPKSVIVHGRKCGKLTLLN